MADTLARTDAVPGGFTPRFHWRVLGTPAPVFPGFEIDICDRVSAKEKPDATWHLDREKGILRDHPEVRQLFGRAPLNALLCAATMVAQIGIAIALVGQPWWMVILAAYVFGSMIDVGLFQLAHECNHALIFRSKRANRMLFTLTTLPMMFSGHHTWWIEHHVHHNHLGSEKDFVKRRRSILLAMKDRIFGHVPGPKVRRMTSWMTTPLFWPIAAFMIVTQTLRAVVGLVVYAATALHNRQWKPNDFALSVLADQHLVSGYHRYKLESWAVTYALMSLGMMTGLFWMFGWVPLAYLFLSALFSTGFLHPLVFGLILSNSHFHGFKIYQPSASYYGWINWITFNFGLHTEHHDFHYIPWHRLSKLHKIAPEYYDNLKKTRSFAALAFKFAFGTREAFNNEEYRNIELLRQRETEGPGRTTPSDRTESDTAKSRAVRFEDATSGRPETLQHLHRDRPTISKPMAEAKDLNRNESRVR